MTTALTTTTQQPISPWTGLPLPAIDPEAVAQAMMIGDLAKMSNEIRIAYYYAACQSTGLNPLTRPFTAIQGDDGKVSLYLSKDGTEQLRRRDQVSLTIVSRETIGDVYIVTARATLPDGRCDEAQGIAPITKAVGTFEDSRSGKRYFKPTLDAQGDARYVALRGLDLANALKRAETQAKRRVTLSICGLGFPGMDDVQGKEVRLELTTGALPEYEAPPVLDAHTVDAAQATRNIGEMFDRHDGAAQEYQDTWAQAQARVAAAGGRGAAAIALYHDQQAANKRMADDQPSEQATEPEGLDNAQEPTF